MSDYITIMCDLFEWKYNELSKGNRIKANKIQKVEDRIEMRRLKYMQEELSLLRGFLR